MLDKIPIVNLTMLPDTHTSIDGGYMCRRKLLTPAIRRASRDRVNAIVINFDGSFGYTSQFLQALFAGIENELLENNINTIYIISQDEPPMIKQIEDVCGFSSKIDFSNWQKIKKSFSVRKIQIKNFPFEKLYSKIS